MMIGYDTYDCFTMEHFRLRQRMTFLLLATVHIGRYYRRQRNVNEFLVP
jgi:hypothetical protein